MTIQPTVEYQSPPNARQSAASFAHLYLLYLFVTLIPIAILMLLLFTVVQPLREVFKDFKANLPQLTMAILTITDGIIHSGGWIIVALCTFLIPLAPARFAASRPAQLPRLVFLLQYIIVLVLLTGIASSIVFFACMQPLHSLIRSVSGAP